MVSQALLHTQPVVPPPVIPQIVFQALETLTWQKRAPLQDPFFEGVAVHQQAPPPVGLVPLLCRDSKSEMRDEHGFVESIQTRLRPLPAGFSLLKRRSRGRHDPR